MELFYDFKIINYSSIDEIYSLGREGWEAFDVESRGFGSYNNVKLRRPVNADLKQWEYILFQTYEMPDEWFDHIRSCGWNITGEPVLYYYGCVVHLFKRTEEYFGLDDGDIESRLNSYGYLKKDVYDYIIYVKEILKVKYEKSFAIGYNIGTYNAVRYWLINIYIPNFLNKNKIAKNIGNYDLLFEEIQNLRIALKNGEYKPDLEETLKYWAQSE